MSVTQIGGIFSSFGAQRVAAVAPQLTRAFQQAAVQSRPAPEAAPTLAQPAHPAKIATARSAVKPAVSNTGKLPTSYKTPATMLTKYGPLTLRKY